MEHAILGAVERPKDERDILLWAVQAPAAIPASFLPENTWLQRNFQGKTAFCGEHAATHLKAILDYVQSGKITRKSPRYGVIKLKTPSSPIYDGFGIDTGTDMRSLFKWLQKFGAADFEPLEDDVTLPETVYCDATVITPAIDANAATSTIQSYGFGATDFQSLCQAIYQNKAVLLLIKCDDGFWGTATPTFTTPKYGHFVVADGYDENHIRVIDSADPNDAFAVKMIAKQYITPQFILESGTAIDMPVAQLQAIVQTAASVTQEITTSPAPAEEKAGLLEEIEQVVEAVEQIL